jgi:hypothetical protein
MMTKEMRKPPPATLKQAMEDNYTVFHSDYSRISRNILNLLSSDFLDNKYEFLLEDFYEANRGRFFHYDSTMFSFFSQHVEGIEFYEKLLENFESSENKFAFIGWKSALMPISAKIECANGGEFYEGYFAEECESFDSILVDILHNILEVIKPFERRVPLILKESYFKVSIGFKFRSKFNPFLHTSNEVIGWLLNGGILQYWKAEDEIRIVERGDDGPKVLWIDDLRFGFNIWLGSSVISVASFVCEILWSFVEEFLARVLFLQTFRFQFRF